MASSYQDSSAVSPYNKPALLGAGTTLTILPIVVVALRFFARQRSQVFLGVDDWLILFALVSLVVCFLHRECL